MNHQTPAAALLALYRAGETLLEFWSGGTPVHPHSEAAADFTAAMAQSAAQARALTAGDYIRAALAVLPPLNFDGSVAGYLHNSRRATLEQIAAAIPAGEVISTNPAGEIAEMIDDDEAAGRLADLSRELWEIMTPEQRSEIIRARVNERP